MKRSFAPPLEPRPESPLKVAIYGLGAIGQELARLARQKPGLRLVAAIDKDPGKQTLDLGVPVFETAAEAVRQQQPDVVLHSTQSFIPDVLPQFEELLQLGVDIVSSTEELSFPRWRYPNESERLDALAKGQGVRLLGTGVNPGFVMDTLPLALSFACQAIDRVRIVRVVDTAKRRYNLQKKTGAGMSVEDFVSAMESGRMGHIGLVESLAMTAAGLGWSLDRIEDEIEPVIAEQPVSSEHFNLEPGQVAGLRQTATGISKGQARLSLHLEMALRAPDPHDGVEVDGTPAIRMRLPQGVMGDLATAACLINAIPRLRETNPGLKTMLDLPLPRAWGS